VAVAPASLRVVRYRGQHLAFSGTSYRAWPPSLPAATGSRASWRRRRRGGGGGGVGGDGGGGGEVVGVVGRLRALKGWTREHATLLEVAAYGSISAPTASLSAPTASLSAPTASLSAYCLFKASARVTHALKEALTCGRLTKPAWHGSTN
jgi:hypothetical protein